MLFLTPGIVGGDKGQFMGFSEDRASGKFGPFYFLTAENPYVLWDAVEHWKAVWRHGNSGGKQSVPCRVFTAPQIDFDRLVDLGTTVPMFDTLQLVQVEQVDRVAAARQDEFVSILRRFGQSTKVLLTAEGMDRRKSFFKALETLGPSEAFPRIYPEDIPGWVRRIASDFEWTLSPAAVELLVSVHGSDLFAVRQTIERTTLYVGSHRRVEISDVEAVITGAGEHDVFQLLEAASRDDAARALSILRSLFAQGDLPTLWLSGLTSQCMRLLKVAGMEAKLDAEIGRAMGLHPFIIRKLRPQASGLGTTGLVQTIGAIFETDWAIKTSTMPTRLAMEVLVWRISTRQRRIEPAWIDLEVPIARE